MIETIRDLLERDPFQPFRIVISSGDRYDVTNPHLVAIGQTQIFYCYPQSDRISFIRTNQIVAVDMVPNAA